MSVRRFLALLPAIALTLATARAGAEPRRAALRAGGDWTRFGYDAARHNSGPARTGITAANVGRLRRQRVTLDGTIDSSPIYLGGATVAGGLHDVFVVTTSYGKTIAVDARGRPGPALPVLRLPGRPDPQARPRYGHRGRVGGLASRGHA